MLFDDVFDVVAGLHALSVIHTEWDHLLRRGATCWTWNISDQMQLCNNLVKQPVDVMTVLSTEFQ